MPHHPSSLGWMVNACGCICQRGALHLPTRRTASANAAHCICQRSALHLPTQRTASANACGCICQRSVPVHRPLPFPALSLPFRVALLRTVCRKQNAAARVLLVLSK